MSLVVHPLSFSHAFMQDSQGTSTLASADLLVKALKLRDGLLKLPHNQLSLTGDDVNNIIDFICTI
jgi:hypothetical protein